MTNQEKASDTTRLRLAYAMNECMKHHGIEDITVREVCTQADCSRQTFYRCFQDKYDLVNWYFDRILKESFDRMGQGRTIRDGLIRKFRYIQEEYSFFHAGFAADTQNDLRTHDFEMIDAFYVNLIENKGIHPDQEILDVLDMYCYASVYKTVQWVMNRMPVTPEELAETMIAAMPKTLEELFEKLDILG